MANKESTALAVKPATQDLTTQAQMVFDQYVVQREKAAKLRMKRQKALMENARYETLRHSAQQIMAEAASITKQFDAQHPKYREDIERMAKQMRESTAKLNEIAMIAFKTGVGLELFIGKGKARKNVQIAMHAQVTLF